MNIRILWRNLRIGGPVLLVCVGGGPTTPRCGGCFFIFLSIRKYVRAHMCTHIHTTLTHDTHTHTEDTYAHKPHTRARKTHNLTNNALEYTTFAPIQVEGIGNPDAQKYCVNSAQRWGRKGLSEQFFGRFEPEAAELLRLLLVIGHGGGPEGARAQSPQIPLLQ